MSEMSQSSQDYLCIRRALGYKLKGEGQLLKSFVDFLDGLGECTITTDSAVSWTRLAKTASPPYQARRMRVVRNFARYLKAIDPRTEVPPNDLFPNHKYRPTPYIYSNAEIQALMIASRTLLPELRAATYETLIGLLASTGMRIGEAMALDREDINWSDGLLVIREAKFNKSREVLLHTSTIKTLGTYAAGRDLLCLYSSTPSFFVSTRGTRLARNTVDWTFRSLVTKTIPSPKHCHIHALRHTFAVNTLLRWYRDGSDIETRMPLLSTYLGHGDPRATYWYLSAVPELLSLATERLERYMGERS